MKKKTTAAAIAIMALLAATPSYADSFSAYWSSGEPGPRRGHYHRPVPPPDTMHRWRSGHWTRGHRGNHFGWWWVIGDSWYLYPEHSGPYPDIYVRPITVVQAPPARAVVVEQPVIVQNYNPTPSGSLLRFESTSDGAMGVNQTSLTYRDEGDRTCREYQTSAYVNGYSQPIYGTACLASDGTWRVVR